MLVDIAEILWSMQNELPKYDGSTDPQCWISTVNEFFDSFHSPESLRLRVAPLHLEGRAHSWFEWMDVDNLVSTWPEFINRLLDYFGYAESCAPHQRARIESLEAKKKKIPLQEVVPLGERVETQKVEFESGNVRKSGSLDRILSPPITEFVHGQNSLPELTAKAKNCYVAAMVDASTSCIDVKKEQTSLLIEENKIKQQQSPPFSETPGVLLVYKVFDEMSRRVLNSLRQVGVCVTLEEPKHDFMGEISETNINFVAGEVSFDPGGGIDRRNVELLKPLGIKGKLLGVWREGKHISDTLEHHVGILKHKGYGLVKLLISGIKYFKSWMVDCASGYLFVHVDNPDRFKQHVFFVVVAIKDESQDGFSDLEMFKRYGAATIHASFSILKAKLEAKPLEWKLCALSDRGIGNEDKIEMILEDVFWPNIESLVIVAYTSSACGCFMGNCSRGTQESIIQNWVEDLDRELLDCNYCGSSSKEQLLLDLMFFLLGCFWQFDPGILDELISATSY